MELGSKRYSIRAGVSTISGYSAHADQKDLLSFIKRMRHWPASISLIHGQQNARHILKEKIEQLYRSKGKEVQVLLPENG